MGQIGAVFEDNRREHSELGYVESLHSEDGFDVQKDMETISLRFGASEVVYFGRGSKVVATKKQLAGLILNSGIQFGEYYVYGPSSSPISTLFSLLALF